MTQLRLPLLKRIQSQKPQQSMTDLNDLASEMQSQLNALLNTRQGSALIAEDYGIPDLNSVMHQSDDPLGHLERSFAQVVSDFEPRLEAPLVRAQRDEESAGRFQFAIEGELRFEQGVLPVLYHTVMTSNGHIQVRR